MIHTLKLTRRVGQRIVVFPDPRDRSFWVEIEVLPAPARRVRLGLRAERDGRPLDREELLIVREELLAREQEVA